MSSVPAIPTYSFKNGHLAVFPYHRQNIRQLLSTCSPDTVYIEGKHDDIEAVAQVPTLRRLDIRHGPLRDIGFLGSVQLEHIILCRTRITSIEPLMCLRGLARVDLSANARLKDLRPLEQCKSLQYLSLYGCHDILFPDFAAVPSLVSLTLDCCSGLSSSVVDSIRSRVKVHERKVLFAPEPKSGA